MPQLRLARGTKADKIPQGHGTLHAIYASIKKSCEINRWPGIDLLIIGGDFQVLGPVDTELH